MHAGTVAFHLVCLEKLNVVYISTWAIIKLSVLGSSNEFSCYKSDLQLKLC